MSRLEKAKQQYENLLLHAGSVLAESGSPQFHRTTNNFNNTLDTNHSYSYNDHNNSMNSVANSPLKIVHDDTVTEIPASEKDTIIIALQVTSLSMQYLLDCYNYNITITIEK